jgi:hypothetical protein
LKRIKGLPSPALVLSLVALVLAVGGGTLAIAGLNQGKVKRIARKQANRQIAHKAPGLSVDHANSADQAANADQLGGIPASGFAQNGCDSSTGQIRGFARINRATVSTTTLSTAGVENAYNCSGGDVLARRFAIGKYEVQFTGSPVQVALATPHAADGQVGWGIDTASVNRVAPGDFFVQIYNVPTQDFIDNSVAILAP